MKYKQVYDGDWVVPIMRGYRMMCCGCGMVHRLDFKVKHHARGHKVSFRARLLKRSVGRRGGEMTMPPDNSNLDARNLFPPVTGEMFRRSVAASRAGRLPNDVRNQIRMAEVRLGLRKPEELAR